MLLVLGTLDRTEPFHATAYMAASPSPAATTPTSSSSTLSDNTTAISSSDVLLLVSFLAVGAVAVGANMVVVLTLALTRKLRVRSSSAFVLSLAVADTAFTLLTVTLTACGLLSRRWPSSKVMCRLTTSLTTFFSVGSAMSVAAVALDRYLAILHCLRYSAWPRWRYVTFVLLAIWIQALVFGITVTTDAVQVSFVVLQHTCDVEPGPSLGYLWVKAIVTFLLPTSVLAYAYARIVCVARLHSRKIDVVSLHSRRGSEDSRRPEVSTNGAVAAGAMFSVRRLSVLSLPSQTEGSGGKARFHISGDLELLGATTPAAVTDAHAPPDPGHSPPQSMLCISFRLLLLVVVFFVCCGCHACAVLCEAVAARSVTAAGPGQTRRDFFNSVGMAGGLPHATHWNYVITSQSSSQPAADYRYVVVPDAVVTASQWLVVLNSMLNPFLYAIMSQRFRFFAAGLFCRRLAGTGGNYYSAQTNGNIFNVSLYSAFLRNLQAPASRRSSVDSCDCAHQQQQRQLRAAAAASSSSSPQAAGRQRQGCESDNDNYNDNGSSRSSRSVAVSSSISSLSSREQTAELSAGSQFLRVPSVFVNSGSKELLAPVEVTPAADSGRAAFRRSLSAPDTAVCASCSRSFWEPRSSASPRCAGSVPGSPDDDFYYSRNNKARIRIVLDLVS